VDVHNPDFAWYSAQSHAIGLPPRCPYAAAERCPRCYQSISLLETTGATAIDESADDVLRRRWEKSPLWPVTAEQATSVSGPPDNPSMVMRNFCPEIMNERFGLFVTHLAQYVDAIDHETARTNLARRNVPDTDSRWQWSSAAPMHYAECPLYSLLDHDSPERHATTTEADLIEAKPGIFGITINLKTAITRFSEWWLRK